MTTPDDTPFPGTGYLQIGIPGVPYSAIRVPIINDLQQDNLWIEHAVLIATLTAKVYREAFPERVAPPDAPHDNMRYGETSYQQAPPPQQARPQAPQQPPQRAQRPAGGAPDPTLVVRGNCPQHRWVPVLPSKLMYQEIEVGEDGVERYAKYFCDGELNGTGKNHGLYARQIVQQE